MLNRQRVGMNTLRVSLKNSQIPPPPRRSNTTLTSLRSTTTTSAFSSTSKQGPAGTTSESSESSSPGMGELISAISQMNQSTALLAAKAFLIATGLVAVGGVAFTWAIKTTLKVEDVYSPCIFIFIFFNSHLFFWLGSGVWSKNAIYIADDIPQFKITII